MDWAWARVRNREKSRARFFTKYFKYMGEDRASGFRLIRKQHTYHLPIYSSPSGGCCSRLTGEGFHLYKWTGGQLNFQVASRVQYLCTPTCNLSLFILPIPCVESMLFGKNAPKTLLYDNTRSSKHDNICSLTAAPTKRTRLKTSQKL